ncbi:MAG: alanine:cation symporter family protein [Chitinophagaceae bacterium]|nr:MAG: alanine:cation symporter family protein [Chitinophagaceae bacterium]
MAKVSTLLSLFFFPAFSFNAKGEESKVVKNFDQRIDDFISPFTSTVESIVFWSFSVNEVSVPFVLVWLVLGAIFFTGYFGFINITKFKLAIDVVRGRYTDPTEKGEVSHFQALTTALSATVGLGNIAGVAIAISLGGPGATFWMIIAGLIGMSSKFAECTLGVKYREVDKEGVVMGGPMYYLSKGFAQKGWPSLGKVLAVFFAIMCIGGSFGGGNMFQANQAFTQFASVVDGVDEGHGWLFGLVMAIVVGMVIIGGIKSIGKVTERVVPFMVGIYITAAIIILAVNYTAIPEGFMLIFTEAFSPTAVGGGFIGVLIQGFRRAAFSNEAGIGSASIAHSAVKTNNPASEGIVALLEPFIDTVVVCTMTALVIIITGNYLNPDNLDGVALTSNAFSTVLPWFPVVLSVAVILFAFSTMLSWSYYGLQSWKYAFGNNRYSDLSYKILFCAFIVLGSSASLGSVIGFSDAMIFAMCFPNILGLIVLRKVIRGELNTYLDKIKKGVIRKNF